MIVLATLNARYIHASLGLRYLFANMGELEADTDIMEFIIGDRPADIVEKLLAKSPRIIGLGVYIWNAEETLKVVELLKQVAPEIKVVLGGPEVSHECEEQAIVALADHVICGPGDLAFAALCRDILKGEAAPRIIRPEMPDLKDIALPYRLYTDHDIAHRLIYVEASRGCPFKCEFCLSALDKTAWPYELERFLAEMDALYRRGARHFKFVDRTFNLNVKASLRILEFFLERLDETLFLHFEVIPDHLPDPLKEALARFPEGSLQLEIGVQTFDPEVQSLISRRQDNDKTAANLRWLREHTGAHIHADLIAGLPGEDLTSFALGFDRLVKLDPQEIQVGILKRLRGAPIARHTVTADMHYSPHPPYTVVRTGRLDFATLQRINRYARYWDLVGNSGRFSVTRPLLLSDTPFERFMAFSDWLYATTGKTHQLALDRLYDWVYRWLTEQGGVPAEAAHEAVAADFHASGTRSIPPFLQATTAPIPPRIKSDPGHAPKRQARHLAD
ncbi:B12-binding domain-containing radical SAM protein [Methylococcus sp. EFPC2]|uniref:B12-binding domain-containing radical SAM protein n=1 Tax=Methylococcus sp. EFPC2 TaxID=2812648 RepID=UPI00196792D1|nr:B12-binding domain-containing radical SAM protein [Methylococcus sp. EFPC2]QSA95465.1 DUF4080 domain-containing protein [Methylococcus sp. EFPC2]